ncbi:MAG: protein-disulfide reductase DsbD family protein [Bdellovibrionales bacterium]
MRIIFLILLAFFTFPAAAQDQPALNARLYSPHTAVGDMHVVPLALEVVLPQGWHTYWRNPGAAGLPPNLVLDEQENVSAVAIQYPAPMRMKSMGLEVYGYNDNVTFPLNVTLKEPGKPISLKGVVHIVMCHEICIAAQAPVALALPAGTAEPTVDMAQWKIAFDQLPLNYDSLYPGNTDIYEGIQIGDAIYPTIIRTQDGALVMDIVHPPMWNFTDVLVEAPNGIMLMAATVARTDTGSIFTSPFENPADASQVNGQELTFTFLGTPRAVELKASVGTATVPAAEQAPEPAAAGDLPEIPGLLTILLFAILGGLILNLMPCVLPVLSLKLLTVINHAGETAARIRRGFLASVLGILVSFWILAGVTIGLKTGGMALGWGIQFQQPAFLIAMIALILVFAANMFGLFEFRAPRFIQNMFGGPSADYSYAKEFFTGVFATLLATPCTAPFVGTAVGFALARGALEIASIFTALGLGLALPYLLVALFPALAQRLPKPGAWMHKLKIVLGIALLATAAWLGWVLSMHTADNPLGNVAEQHEELEWNLFIPESVPGLVAQGKVVFIDLTADWCLTCKVNKRVVLNQEPTLGTLKAENVYLMRGDWTRPNPAIQQYLEKYGRFGIPFNIVFGPGAPQGIILPELLTFDAVIDALSKAK